MFCMKIRIIITLLSLFVVSHEVVFSQFDFQIAFSSITCNGLCDGNATVSLISTQNCGNGPYQYQIIGPSPSVATTTSPVTLATSYTFANLCAGSYSVNALVSGNVCASGSFNITQPPLLYTSISTILPLCAGNDGSALITVNGGQPSGCANSCRGYNVLWTGPGGMSGGSLNACPKEIVTCSQSSPTNTYSLTNLSPGTYNVTIEDHNNCPVSTSFTISPPPPPITVSGLLANNSIDIIVTGGTPGYTYSWSNGATTEDLSNLSPGNYTVTITDANGCTASQVFTIQNQNPVLSINSTISPVLCFGGQDGMINLTITGGNAPYNVSWSGPVSGNPAGNEIVNSGGSYIIANIPAGTYTLTITDSNGNADTQTVTITQPQSSLLASAVGTNVLCNGVSTGSINLTVSGGTGIYTYVWNTGAITQDINGLTVGTFTVTVTDANGCTATTSATITQPSALVVTDVVSTAIPCGGSQGVVTVSAVGGTPAYIGTGNFTVSAGTHTFTVTDANGCTASSSATITEPLPLLLTGSVNGNNIDISVSGGTVPYNYSWSNGAVTQDLPNVPLGSYVVIVTDAYNCAVSDTFVVNNAAIEEKQLDEITLFPNPTNDQLTIRRSVNSLGHHSYVIQDSYGRKVLEGSFEDNEENLSVAHLAPGLYQLHVGVKTISFVVIH